MIKRATRLRWRRRARSTKQKAGDLGANADQKIDKFVFRKLDSIIGVRRFVISWIMLLVFLMGGLVVQTRALSRFYQTLEPGHGGIYSEGIVGSFTNANPIYASSASDQTVARLIFSGLMRYDNNGKLVGDLAETVESDDVGKVYTVKLKHGVKWHDGENFDASDVVFTYKTIQTPDARSTLLQNWQDVEIEAIDEFTVKFTLPSTVASFPHSLITGIIPEHILGRFDVEELRGATFNTARPIGTGLFMWDGVQVTGDEDTREEQIGLVAYKDSHIKKPNLERFVVRAFRTEKRLLEVFQGGDLSGIGGLQSAPGELDAKFREYNIPLNQQVMAFFKSSNDVLKDKNVRVALTIGTSRVSATENLGYPVKYVDSPFLKDQFTYDPEIVQPDFNQEKAKNILDKAGWTMGPDGIREKDDLKLSFKLYSQTDSELGKVAQSLQQQWRELGANVEIILEPKQDLNATTASHSYDALLIAIELGTDPDVYAYWHSTQADPRSNNRLNLSEFKSDIADASLEAGRSRVNKDQRKEKYEPFLKEWVDQAPAVGLYQPRYYYVTKTKLFGFDPLSFNTPVDRFANIENWSVSQERVDIY
ncbi:MAG: peptide ABC transporter substrate-binding protein [bacterium]|nr:peptide ABC transporter substrate-binding protein [bacterium]